MIVFLWATRINKKNDSQKSKRERRRIVSNRIADVYIFSKLHPEPLYPESYSSLKAAMKAYIFSYRENKKRIKECEKQLEEWNNTNSQKKKSSS